MHNLPHCAALFIHMLEVFRRLSLADMKNKKARDSPFCLCKRLTFIRLMTYIYMSYRTANLQMLHFIYLFTNIGTEYFKHAARSPFFPLQNAVYFIMLPSLVPVLFTF